MRLTTIFALCVLCTVALSNVGAFQTVTVLSPQTLVAQFPSGIDTRPALFGVPNYASSITGPVIYATPDDRDACQPLDSLNSMDTKIVMVDRGECTFVQKVKHAQDAGANAVIVVDNVEETNMPFMADDGSGVSVSIPSILVHKSDGQKIKDSLANGDTPMLTMSWGLPHPDGIVEWNLWTSASDPQSSKFKKVFKPAIELFSESIDFTPKYFVVDGEKSGCTASSQPCSTQCTNEGKYCAVDPDGKIHEGLSGANIISEDLRQICIWDHLASRTNKGDRILWWDYVSEFDEKCGGAVNTWTDACANTIMSSLGIDHTAVDTCIANSGGLASGQNTLLDKALVDRAESGVFYLPTVYINDQAYRGDLDCPEMKDGIDVEIKQCGVLEAICGGFSVDAKPDVCFTASQCPLGVTHRDACGICGGTSDDEESCGGGSVSFPTWAIFFIVVGGIGLVALGVYCYMLRQQNVMRDDIDALLKRYLPLEEGGAGSGMHPMSSMAQSDAMNSFA